jgi:hypothetical protein
MLSSTLDPVNERLGPSSPASLARTNRVCELKNALKSIMI